MSGRTLDELIRLTPTQAVGGDSNSRDSSHATRTAGTFSQVDAHGRDGWTPLCMAVRCNAVGTVKALLAAKANVLAPSGNGKTALEVASMQPNAAGLVRTVMDTQT